MIREDVSQSLLADSIYFMVLDQITTDEFIDVLLGERP